MIKIDKLDYWYKKGKPVLENISLQVNSGIYGLLGENGTGKTTLLHLMSGLLFPEKGNIEIDGYESVFRNPEMLKHLFLLPEDYRYPTESITDLAKRHAVFYPYFSRKQLNGYLNEFNIDANTKLSEYSFGQKKKAMIAYVISLNTPYLLLDEPTNGLDISSKTSFKKMLTHAISDDKCVIVSTHQVHDIENLLDAIIILNDNRVALNSTIEEITDKLLFTKLQSPSPDALYQEQTLDGYSSVLPNKSKHESMVNIEMLYKAVIFNKESIVNMFYSNREQL